MRQFIEVMHALRNENRVRILKILRHGELCVCEIQAAIGMSQGCISKNLGILKKACLVDCRKKGLWAYYRLAHEPRSAYAASILGNLRHWLDNDPEVVKMVESLTKIQCANLCEKKRKMGTSV